MKYNPPIGGAANDPYVDANPATGVEGSPVPAAAIEHHQREIVNVITAAGLTPDAGDLTQLYQAVQRIAAGGDYKASVLAATTANIALTGLQTVDGVALAAGDRVLVKNQTAGAENGIYLASAGAWTRTTDADAAGELTSGAIVPVESGTLNADTLWILTTDGTITIGTTALVFEIKSGNEATKAGVQQAAYSTSAAGGTADAITGTFTPAITALTNGMTVYVRAASANTTTTPTFSPNGLAAKTVVKGNNLALVAGDIAGAGHWLTLQYDSTLDKWVLLNPATGALPVLSAFSAYQSTGQAISANTNTTVLFQTEEFDITGEYDAATGIFTAAAAGIYEFGAQVLGTQDTTGTTWTLSLIKNAVVHLLDYNGRAISALNGLWVRKGTLLLSLAAGNTVQVRYNVSVADTLNSTARNTVFWGRRVR